MEQQFSLVESSELLCCPRKASDMHLEISLIYRRNCFQYVFRKSSRKRTKERTQYLDVFGQVNPRSPALQRGHWSIKLPFARLNHNISHHIATYHNISQHILQISTVSDFASQCFPPSCACRWWHLVCSALNWRNFFSCSFRSALAPLALTSLEVALLGALGGAFQQIHGFGITHRTWIQSTALCHQSQLQGGYLVMTCDDSEQLEAWGV